VDEVKETAGVTEEAPEQRPVWGVGLGSTAAANGWTPTIPRAVDPPPPSGTDSLERGARTLTAFLLVGMVGVALLLVGLVWDGFVHARDPEAVHEEGGLFTLASLSHVLLLLGGGLAVGSLTAATAQTLSARRRPRAAIALVAVTLVTAAATAGALKWVSSADARPPIATGPLAPAPGPETHRIGIVNSHADGECRPTKAQYAAAQKLVADTERATAKYASLTAALADGYVAPANPAMVDHYRNDQHIRDGKVLDPSRPESLMYAQTPRGPVLAGVMYITNIPGEFGPEPGGCLTRWHVHTNLCLTLDWASFSEMPPAGTCPAGTFRWIPPPALHVWLVDVPGGRFAAEADNDSVMRAVGP
jgi:hypothetical protein